MSSLSTNLSVLIYMIKRQKYYTQIIEAANNNAGGFIHNNKIYFFTFYDMETHRNYQLTGYEILYSIKAMYLYTPEQYNTSSLTTQNFQVFGGKYDEFKQRESVYRAFHKAYLEALYYGDVYTQIQNAFYYKNTGLEGCFFFKVPISLFPNVPQNEVNKAYSYPQIYQIYSSLSAYYT